MAVLCKEHDLLFIEEPRTGTTSVRHVLFELGGIELPCYRHVPLTYLLQHGLITEPDSYFKFVTVRNPWDSVVSLYEKRRTSLARIAAGEHKPNWWLEEGRPYVAEEIKVAMTCNFSEFVARCVPGRPKGEQMRAGVDFVMRYELLEEDLAMAFARVGLTRTFHLPQLNKTANKRPYQSYYDATSQRIVYQAYRAVIERFGYSFDDSCAYA